MSAGKEKEMTAIRKSFCAAVVSAVLWGMASVLAGSMGPIATYKEALKLAFEGELSLAFTTFWTAAEMFFYWNGLVGIIGLFSVAVHYGAVIALFCSIFLYQPRHKDRAFGAAFRKRQQMPRKRWAWKGAKP